MKKKWEERKKVSRVRRQTVAVVAKGCDGQFGQIMKGIHPSHLFPVVERPALDNKEGWRNKDILKEIKTSTVKERDKEKDAC